MQWSEMQQNVLDIDDFVGAVEWSSRRLYNDLKIMTTNF